MAPPRPSLQVISEINGRVGQLADIAAQLGKLADVSGGHAGPGGEKEVPLTLLSLQPDEVPEDREKVRDRQAVQGSTVSFPRRAVQYSICGRTWEGAASVSLHTH
jgi:hypothetical protein